MQMQHDDVVGAPQEAAPAGVATLTAAGAPATAHRLREDPAVVAAVRSGDERVFARLVRQHERALRAHCTRMLRGRPEAEDAVQEALLNAWRHRHRFEGRSSFRGWLFRIATNACTDVLRRPATQRCRPVAAVVDEAEDAPGGTAPLARASARAAPAPDDALVARETVELALLAALEHLPARQRAVLCLRDVLGWTAEETAELLGTSVHGANSALQRARATLRARGPADRQGWRPTAAPSPGRRRLVRRLADAGERDDASSVLSLLRLAS